MSQLGPSPLTQPQKTAPTTPPTGLSHLYLAALTFLAFFIDGYHPWSEDGGLYAASIEHLLYPALFPQRTAFIAAYTHLSLFPWAVAAAVRLTHLPLPWTLLILHLLTLWLLLHAADVLLRTCGLPRTHRTAATALLAVWSSLPIAGTSLLLTDPYLSARSLSTPLTLLALAAAIRTWDLKREVLRCLGVLLLLAMVHPLAALHAAVFVILCRIVRPAARPGAPHTTAVPSWVGRESTAQPARPATGKRAMLVFILGTLLAAAIMKFFSPQESADAVTACVTRYYWFLSQWHWYELCGLLAPCLILYAFLRSSRPEASPHLRTLLRASLLTAALAVLLSTLFIHSGDPHELIDRTQPLRVFLPIYILMTLLLGTALGDLWQRQARVYNRLPLPLILLAGMFTLAYVARDTYSHSQPYEWPQPKIQSEARTQNPWQQAFLWARDHTPPDALFALDADYITQPGEDAQFFPAIAHRSALADRSKDGGIAANLPALAPQWAADVHRQTDLSALPDSVRDLRLAPDGVSWVILKTSATTSHPCPYTNATVKVCRLTPPRD